MEDLSKRSQLFTFVKGVYSNKIPLSEDDEFFKTFPIPVERLNIWTVGIYSIIAFFHIRKVYVENRRSLVTGAILTTSTLYAGLEYFWKMNYYYLSLSLSEKYQVYCFKINPELQFISKEERSKFIPLSKLIEEATKYKELSKVD